LRFTGTTRNRQEPLGGEIATDAPELLAGDRAVLQPVAVGIDHGMVQAGSNAGWGEMAVAVHTGPPALTLTSCRQSYPLPRVYGPPNLLRPAGSATMSFNTPVTPEILATFSCATLRSSSVRTLPLRVRYPSLEVTKICRDLVIGFARSAAFACAVRLRSFIVFRAVAVISHRSSWSASRSSRAPRSRLSRSVLRTRS